MPNITLPTPGGDEDTWAPILNAAITDINDAVDEQADQITDKLNTTDAPELIRDTMGSTLVAGANVVITVDDPGNTITISASGGGGGGAVDSVNGQTGVVVLDADDIGDGSTKVQMTTAERSKLSGIASGAEVNVVDSVAGRTGDVTLTKTDVDLSNVDNTSDLNKPISSDTQSALDLKADTADLGTAAFEDSAAFATFAQGALADSATQPGDLSTVATTGAYADLSGKPTLGTAAASDSTDFATAAQGAKADTAVQPAALTAKENVLTAGANITINRTDPENPIISASGGGGGAGDWGSIGGTLSDQTDLQAALDAKANTADLGTAAESDATDFATAAQGAKADTAVQPGALSGYVPTTRTVNGQALSGDIALDAEDVGALPDTYTPATPTLTEVAAAGDNSAVDLGAGATLYADTEGGAIAGLIVGVIQGQATLVGSSKVDVYAGTNHIVIDPDAVDVRIADESAVLVDASGATFAQAPIVPDASFAIAKVAGLAAALGTKASFVIVTTGDEERPDGDFCIWLDMREGEVSNPTNFGGSDIRFRPGSVTPGGDTAPTIVTTSLDAMTVDIPFVQAIVTSGTAPFEFTVSAGSLPAGLTLDPDAGFLYGTPTADGAYSFTVQAENGEGSDTQAFSGSVSDGDEPVAPTITTTSLGTLTEGVPFDLTLAATGDPTITWDVSAGTLPSGLTLETDGQLHGTPDTPGAYSFTARATNDTGNDTQAYSGTVDAASGGTALNFWGATAPDTTGTITIETDGGGSLRTGVRFISDVAINVLGYRVWNPASSDSTFLNADVTGYAYVENYTGSIVNGTTTFAGTPVQTKTDANVRTAGTWTDVLFDSPVALAAYTGASTTDLLTVAVLYAGGDYYVNVPYVAGGNDQITSDNTELVIPSYNEATSAVFNLSGNQGRAVDAIYGIDLLYEVA